MIPDAVGASEILNLTLLAVVAIATAIPAYYAWNERRLRVDLKRFKEKSTHPLDSDWKVQVIRINRTLKRAELELDGKPLHWDDDDLPHTVYLEGNHTRNFRIPVGTTEKSILRIKDGDKTVKKVRYGDIPLDRQYR